ncbi:hypothetical protein FD04_GL001351 [Secundilactobacillus odoratitofui DSM 19909 = JCM 15043]|uniref:Uncharacterized protein n=1 Tax=Secundilactobacillus odoratitofui DSM 19909 = JCM 15043 TaxID=1423776 RepID=A0A0R1M012_9LACO|nr:hypothetical protein FD04_GL001351 [Secundilactobacillus odoratitofui DSM 19909 = JCM 15043]
MCGEYFEWHQITTDQSGSPPHVRRILTGNSLAKSVIGITSACAENTRAKLTCISNC